MAKARAAITGSAARKTGMTASHGPKAAANRRHRRSGSHGPRSPSTPIRPSLFWGHSRPSLPASEQPDDRQRLDKWLWCARIVRTREAAATLIDAGHVRINGQKTLKPGHSAKIGDVLTIVLNSRVRVLCITGLAERRRPAADTALYQEPERMPLAGENLQKSGAR
jgi:ribosome-associated heat shock protein Hsp15